MRVLVTRPQPSAAATAARLAALGHEAILLPMMEAVHYPQAARDALARPHSAIAVTSAEAMRALAAIRDDLTPHLSTPVFCVGAATAQAATQLGFRFVVTGPGTGAALAECIADNPHGLEHGIVYLAGEPRSPAFERAVLDAGISCRTVELYRMSPLPYASAAVADLLRSRTPAVALFYSRETALHFFAIIGSEPIPALRDMRLLCLSQHIADAIPHGIGTTVIAAEPNEDSLLALI